MSVTKILCIGFLRVTIPFAGENAAPADSFECAANAADTCEQINELETTLFGMCFRERKQLLQCMGQIGRGATLPRFPPADSSNANTEVFGYNCLGMVLASFRQIGK